MERTTIMLPADLKDKTMRLARRLGISFGEMVRNTLEQTVSRSEGKRRERKADPLFADTAVFQGKGPKDLSVNHDKYLYEDR